MKNKTIKNLILSGMLAFVFTTANSASAYVRGVWEPEPQSSNYNPAFTTVVSSTNTNPVIAVNTSPVNTTTTSTTTTPVTTTTTTPVVTQPATTQTQAQPVKSTTTAKPKTTAVKSSSSNLPAVKTDSSDKTSDLTALSMNGSGGFMPSSFFQWFLVVLLILAIIIVARKISHKPAEHGAHPAGAH